MAASWNTCPIKQDIVKLLDYESRCNLKLCSKHDYSAVNATKFVADELQIAEIPSRMSDEKTIIRVKIDTFTIWFIGKDDVTKVDRAWGNGEILEEWSVVRQENRRDIAIRFLEKICWRGTFEAKKIYMNLLSLEPLKNWKLKCDWLRISSCSPENSPSLTLQWLRKVDCQLKKLVADDVARLDVADVPHVLDVTETLHLENCDISDEHLEQITAADVFIRSETLSLNAAMRNVERFLKYGREDDSFRIFSSPGGWGRFQKDQIPMSLVVRDLSEDESDEYLFKITGGFENVHGNQRPRVLQIGPWSLRIVCPTKRPVGLFPTWPFTDYA